jgi:PAS domain S-box-containing protein
MEETNHNGENLPGNGTSGCRQAQPDPGALEAYFRDFFFNNPQSVQLVDHKGFTLQVNEAHTRLFGSVPPPGYSVFDDPLILQQGLAGLWDNVRNGEVVNFPEFRYNTAELSPQLPDRPVWLQMTVFPLPGTSGDQSRYVLMHTDITGRKRVQQEYTTLFREMLDGFALHEILTDAEGTPVDYRFLAVNPAFERMTGMKAGDVVGRNVSEILPGTEHHWIETYGRVALTGEPVQFESYHAELGKHFEVTAFRPAPGQFTCVFQDITERKRAEDALKETEERLEFVIEGSQLGYWDWNIQTGKVHRNAQWAGMLGYTLEEIELNVKQWSDLQHPDDMAYTWQSITDHLEGRTQAYRAEYRMRAKSGQYKWILDQARIVARDAEGRPLRMSGTHTDITDRKQAEEALRQNRNMLDTVLNTIPQSVFWKDRDSRYLGCNAQFASAVGMQDPAEIIGKTDYDLPWPKEEAEAYRADDRYVMDNNLSKSHIIEPLQQADDSRIWIDTTKIPLHDSHGNTYGVLGVYEDITDRKQAEEVIRTERMRLAGIIEGTHVGTWEWNVKTGETVFNERWADIIGYTLAEISPVSIDTWTRFAHPDDLVKSRELIRRHFDGELDYYEFESRMRHKNGEWVWILDRGKVVSRSADGTPLMMLGTHQDITDRKLAEEAKKLNENRLEALVTLSNMTDAGERELTHFAMEAAVILTSSTIGYIAFMNDDETVLTMYAWSKQAMHECAIDDKPLVYPVETTGLWGEAVRQRRAVITNDYAAPNPWKKGTPDGHVRIGRHMNAPAFEGSRIVCVAGVGNKATDYDDDDVRQLSLLISGLWSIIRRKRAEEELIRAKEKAEESDRLKSAFLANMSHEIRTPMNGILGFADLLKEPGLSGDEQQHYITIIEKSGQRMLNIINDIIDISKIEAGLMTLKMAESNIVDLLEYIHTFFKPEAEAKGIRLSVSNKLTHREATFITDREKLYAILTNLVKNAIKYSDRGEIELGCSRKVGIVEIYVRDTGIGIPQDRQQAIFERFIQADIDDKMARQGAGLGLAISKAYAEMMGGGIRVESEPGKGSVFFLTLPFKTSADEQSETHLQAQANTGDDGLPGLSVLIVDDDEVSVMLLESELKKNVRNIMKVSTGPEAVELVRNTPGTDLVLMDILLPGMAGYEATRQIRQFNSHVVIIAQTAYGLAGDREKALDAGCNDYIAKPIIKKELQAMLRKHFGKKEK